MLERALSHRSDEISGKSLEEFDESLAHLNKALELDGSLLEALFNRALCYRRMGLLQQAQED